MPRRKSSTQMNCNNLCGAVHVKRDMLLVCGMSKASMSTGAHAQLGRIRTDGYGAAGTHEAGLMRDDWSAS